MSEATLQGMVYRGEVRHLQGIMFLQVNTDQIPSEVQKAILFRREAVIRLVLIEVLLLAAADLPHHTAADRQDLYQVVLTLQDHLLQDPHQGLHQVVDHQVVVVLLQEGDSLKQ
jgi:hypothetical protein